MVNICFLIMLGFNIYSAIRQRKLIKKNRRLRKDYDKLNFRYAEQAFLLGQYTIGEKSK